MQTSDELHSLTSRVASMQRAERRHTLGAGAENDGGLTGRP